MMGPFRHKCRHSIVEIIFTPILIGCRSVQFSALIRLGHQGHMRNDSAEILLQSFLQEAHLSSSGIGRNVHSLMLSIQHFSVHWSNGEPMDRIWTEYCSELYNHKTNGDPSVLNCPQTHPEDDHPIPRNEAESTTSKQNWSKQVERM